MVKIGNMMHGNKKVHTSEKDNIDEVFRLIGKAKDIIITTHINPDGDALGSALALYFYLTDKGKNPSVYINGEVPFNLEFMKGIEHIINYETHKDDDLIKAADLIFVVDLNDCRRLRSLSAPILDSTAPKIVIDHHIDPTDFADVYIIDAEATSTGELIWNTICSDKSLKLTKEIAEALYVAIMTDTGSFRFPRTDGDVHRIIARLVDAGADPVELYEKVYNNNPLRTMKLLGQAYAGMELFYGGRLCVMKITTSDLAKVGAIEDDVENFVEKTLSISGVVIGILITEIQERNEVRISFRSKGDYNIRNLAMQFNGGGHIHAAGARVVGREFNEVAEEVIKATGVLFQ